MGAPRSGTTLLASMLSSRNDAIALPEMHYIHNLLTEELIFGKTSRKKTIKYLLNHPMFMDLKIASKYKDLDKIVAKKFSETIFNIISLYNLKYHQKQKLNIWIEHSPHNFEYFNVLNHFFSNSKFIHIIRDGRAVYSSTKETDWGYKDVISGSFDWGKRVTDCLILEKSHPNKVLTVRYEDVIKNPIETIKLICKFASIDFQISMLNSGGIILPSFAKFQQHANKKPHTKSILKWKNELKRYEIEHFTAVNYDLLNAFGYEYNDLQKNEMQGLVKILLKCVGIVKKFIYHAKFRRRLNRILK